MGWLQINIHQIYLYKQVDYFASKILNFKVEKKVEPVVCKGNSVQEACAKCFAVHILKFEILQTTWKNKTKNIKVLDLLMKTEN